MSRLRDNINRIVLTLGMLLFVFIFSNTQACVFADGTCVDLQQSHPQAKAQMPCHISTTRDAQKDAANHHSQHSKSEQTDEDCCEFMPANLVDFATVKISNPSVSQFLPPSFFPHFDSLSRFYYIDFGQREIIFLPPESSSVFHSPGVTFLHSGRAPPPAVLA